MGIQAFFADFGDNPFLLRGLIAGVLAGITCGTVGPYVVTRRIVFLAGAVAHIAIGGIGAAIYLQHAAPALAARLDPLLGATVVAVAAALLLAWVHHRVAERLDTLIGALWAIGMAAGILLIKLTPGYQPELMSYLFGNLVFVSRSSLLLLAVLTLIVVLVTILMHRRFFALCIDPEHARLRGIGVLATDATLLVLVALTVITLTKTVGMILTIALLALPAATALRHAARLPAAIAASIGICVLVATVPRITVYGTELSPEPAIVLAAGLVYALSFVWRRLVGGRRPSSAAT